MSSIAHVIHRNGTTYITRVQVTACMHSTDQGLNHVGPVVPHCIDKLKHIEVLLPLHPLQHGVQTDVRARATYTSTVREAQGCEGGGR